MTTQVVHVPVMSTQVIDMIAPALMRPGAVFVDATLGLGGHSLAILTRFPEAFVIGIDRDSQAIEVAQSQLAAFSDRVTIVHTTYDNVGTAVASAGKDRVDAILFDLGLSSLQIDSAGRGFSYSRDAPLDMRMDADSDELTAADVVNTYDARDLARIFKVYGDERFATRIAAAIVEARDVEPFTTSARLVDQITRAIPVAARQGGHPAKKVFQALRMEVNSERASLEAALPQGLKALRVGGRMVVLSYHSGEDRIVKRTFAQAASDAVPVHLVEVPAAMKAQFSLLARGAVQPDQAEIEANPRARSARMRGIERIKETS